MRPETALQRDIRKRLAAYGFESVHVPNGSVLAGERERRSRQMASLKRDGLRIGFPDLLVYGKNGRLGHIEVKCEGNYQSPAQRAVGAWLADWGHLYAVCRSQEDVDETLTRWGWL